MHADTGTGLEGEPSISLASLLQLLHSWHNIHVHIYTCMEYCIAVNFRVHGRYCKLTGNGDKTFTNCLHSTVDTTYIGAASMPRISLTKLSWVAIYRTLTFAKVFSLVKFIAMNAVLTAAAYIQMYSSLQLASHKGWCVVHIRGVVGRLCRDQACWGQDWSGHQRNQPREGRS